MKFAKYTFLIAGISGIILLFPLYFFENRISNELPPPITHPEFYYGFIGVALAFQVLFIIISLDPIKYRLMIIPAIIEKFSFVLALVFLYFQGRISQMWLGAGMMDLILGVLFIMSYFKAPKNRLYRSF